MTGAFSRQLLRQEFPFFLMATLTWCSLFVLAPASAVPSESQILFAVIASISSFLLLKFLGYFDVLRLHPRKSDLLLVLCAMPLGGTASRLVFIFGLGVKIFSFESLLISTTVISIVIFGAHHLLANILVRSLKRKKVVLDLLPREKSSLLADFANLGMLKYLEFLTRKDLEFYLNAGDEKQIGLLVISRATAGKFSEDKTLLRAHLSGVPITDYSKISSDLTGRTRLSQTDLWAYVLSATPQTPLMRLYSKFKVVAEPIIAVLLGIIFTPLMVTISALIKLSSNGPVLYRQVRTGYLDKPFVLLKFRSMYTDAEVNGPRWASAQDSRVTPLGKFLRRTRMDELPQLWNVFKGEMGFFGPRPERPEIAAELKREVPLFSLRTAIRPGITGWAQVCAGYAASIEESKEKLEYDLYYIQHMSPRIDLVILLKTILVAFFGNKAERPEIKAEVAEQFLAAANQRDSFVPQEILLKMAQKRSEKQLYNEAANQEQ